jgi:hypothetical protein
MMKILAYLIAAMLLLLGQSAYAGSGKLFNINASGALSNVSINLCLVGKGPLSCQNYTVNALNLTISPAINNHTYPSIGIKVNTPGYTIDNLGIDCTPIPNGYCLFLASKTRPKSINIQRNSAAQYTINATGDTNVIPIPTTQQVNSKETGTINLNITQGYVATIASNTCGGSLSGNTFTTGAVTADCSVNFASRLSLFTVTASGDNHVQVDKTSQSVNYTSTGTVKLTVATGYTAKIASNTCGGSLSDNTFTTGVVTADCSVNFASSLSQFTVTASGDDYVQVDKASQSMNYSSTGTVNLTVATGYTATIASNTCGGSLSGNSFITGAITADCSVSFASTPVVLTTVTVNPASSTITTIDTQEFSAVGQFSDGTNSNLTNVTWTSNDANVATINSMGLATGVNTGFTTITATASSGQTGTSSLSVGPAPTLTAIHVTPNTSSITTVDSLQYAAAGDYSDGKSRDVTNQVAWISNNTSIVQIDPTSGLAKAISQGNGVTITATVSSLSDTATLNVTAAPSLLSITVTPSNPNVPSGLTQQFIATGQFVDNVNRDITTHVQWSTNSGYIVTIDANGLATVNGSQGQSDNIIAAYQDDPGITGSTQIQIAPPIIVSRRLNIGGDAYDNTVGYYSDILYVTDIYSDGSEAVDTSSGYSYSITSGPAIINRTNVLGYARGSINIAASSTLYQPLSITLNFNSGPNSNTLQTIAGTYNANTNTGTKQLPMLAISMGGGDWYYPISDNTNISRAGNVTVLNSSSCNGTYTKPFCVAAGRYVNNQNLNAPLLGATQSINSWGYAVDSDHNLPINFVSSDAGFVATTCATTGTSLCIAVGGYNNQYPMLIQNNNTNWDYKIQAGMNLPTDFMSSTGFKAVDCQKLNATQATCIATGSFFTNTTGTNLIYPMIAATFDGGNTWSYPILTTPTDMANDLTMSEISCSNATSTGLCIAAGRYKPTTNNQYPLVYLSYDGAQNWTTLIQSGNTAGLPADFYDGLASSASCYGDAVSGFCVISGIYRTSATSPYYPFVSKATISNSIIAWSSPVDSAYFMDNSKISAYLNYTLLSADFSGLPKVSCSGNNSDAQCAMVGRYYVDSASYYPLALVSNDAGTTWFPDVQKNTNLPTFYQANGIFNAVKCYNDSCAITGSYTATDALNYPIAGHTYYDGNNASANYFIQKPAANDNYGNLYFVNPPTSYTYGGNGSFNGSISNSP